MLETKMAEAAVESIRRYYCHQCLTEITPIIPEYTCPTCNSGFIEEVAISGNDANSRSVPQQNSVNASTSSFSRLANDPSSQFAEFLGSTFGVPISGQMPESSTAVGQSNAVGGEARPGPSGPTIRMVHAGPRNPYVEGLLNYFISTLGRDVHHIAMQPLNMFQIHGNPADYAWGAGGLDAIITQLLNQLENSGPPPADREKIEALPTVAVSLEQVERTLQCSVCMEFFIAGEEVKRLPCEHHYHEGCILPWLEMHGTCPVCRKDLTGHDTSTEVPSVPSLAEVHNRDAGSRPSTSNTSADTNPSLD